MWHDVPNSSKWEELVATKLLSSTLAQNVVTMQSMSSARSSGTLPPGEAGGGTGQKRRTDRTLNSCEVPEAISWSLARPGRYANHPEWGGS